MAAAMGQAFPSFYSDYLKKNTICFHFQQFLRKNFVTLNICVSNRHSYCSLENCCFNIFLIGSYFDQVLQQLGNFHFTYQIIDCLYTLYKYRVYSNNISYIGEVLNHFDCDVHHNLKWKGAEKMPRVARKRVLRTKLKRHSLCCNQKLASTQIIGSAFLERVRKVQNPIYEHDLLKKSRLFC